MLKNLFTILICSFLCSCASTSSESSSSGIVSHDTIMLVDAEGMEMVSDPKYVGEISVPDGYQRISISDTSSFAYYLRSLSLKPLGTPVYCYNGFESSMTSVSYAVIDGIDVGTEDLQQCADAIIRLRAEWLYKHKRYDEIAFHFTNGWLCEYTKWAEGNRVSVNGNRTSWYAACKPDYSYATFRKYLNMIFNYAGTLSLSRELSSIDLLSLSIGDVFIKGGSPGHAILVIDVAEHPETHDKCFLVAESYMPAQDIHILINEDRPSLSPWFSVKDFMDASACVFPSYWYETDALKRFD